MVCRCHHSFFNDFNFIPMFLACTMRTSIELCILLWPAEGTTNWCQAVLFLVLFQMQTISSLLVVFIFQNALLTILASKIYLSKNYATSMHALTKARKIQIAVATVFTPIQLASLFCVSQSGSCWPSFSAKGGDTLFNMANIFLVMSPIIQLSSVCQFNNIFTGI